MALILTTKWHKSSISFTLELLLVLIIKSEHILMSVLVMFLLTFSLWPNPINSLKLRKVEILITRGDDYSPPCEVLEAVIVKTNHPHVLF